jgi:hypothetical protein
MVPPYLFAELEAADGCVLAVTETDGSIEGKHARLGPNATRKSSARRRRTRASRR